MVHKEIRRVNSRKKDKTNKKQGFGHDRLIIGGDVIHVAVGDGDRSGEWIHIRKNFGRVF